MICSKCGSDVPEKRMCTYKGKPTCEDCVMRAGLFPLGHKGPFRKQFAVKDSLKGGSPTLVYLPSEKS